MLDEALQAEASQVLNAIFDITENQRDGKQERLAKIGHALAMLYYLLHDIDRVIPDYKQIYVLSIRIYLLEYIIHTQRK